MFHDYVETVAFLQNRYTDLSPIDTKWRLAKTYNMPFTIGISAAGNLTGALENFLICLQRGVVDLIAIAKVCWISDTYKNS